MRKDPLQGAYHCVCKEVSDGCALLVLWQANHTQHRRPDFCGSEREAASACRLPVQRLPEKGAAAGFERAPKLGNVARVAALRVGSRGRKKTKEVSHPEKSPDCA